ncbi:MAG: dTDP-glucose 4,6-dehydratase, partial [Elusimicrobiota bacterium]|nr:dTDP-glucose 4,6-dehydratase [Elusimicrobiota bacterium]
MNLLITGGCGFIGSNFIRYILNKYHEYKIVNLDKLTYAGNPDNLKDIESNTNYNFVKGDICDATLVNRLCAEHNIDVIVNFAAESHVDRSILDPEAFIKTDVFGTYVLLESARKYNHKKYIQISTDEVYGSRLTGSFTEESPLKPSSPYSASKASADLLVHSYIVTYGFPGIIVRSTNNFGPYQYPEKIIPFFVTQALEDKPLPLYGDGLNVRDWLYVLDNVEAIDLIIHKGVPGEIYNVSAENELTNIQLTKYILKILSKPESLIKLVEDRPGHDRRYSIDSTKIRTTLNWQPSIGRNKFELALRETVKWYIDNSSW